MIEKMIENFCAKKDRDLTSDPLKNMIPDPRPNVKKVTRS